MEASGEIPSEKNSPVFDHYADISEEVEDPRLGLIVPMRPANFDEATQEFVPTPETPFPRIFRLERCIVDVEEFISVIEKSEQRLQMAHENVIQMLDYCYSPSNEEQSEFLFAGFYEQSDTDLEREMEFRGRQEKQFGDLEIFNLIKETINGLVFLQENHLIHGDLRYPCAASSGALARECSANAKAHVHFHDAGAGAGRGAADDGAGERRAEVHV